MITYRGYRNEVTKQIRLSKTTHWDKLSNDLKTNNVDSKDWWKTLKCFILPITKISIPPLSKNGALFSDNKTKANILYEYFTDQTILRESNVELPTTILDDNRTVFLNIEIVPCEVKNVLQSLQLGKWHKQ